MHTETIAADRDDPRALADLAHIGIVPAWGCDPVLAQVTLPDGWSLVPNALDRDCTDIVDGRGNTRASSWYLNARHSGGRAGIVLVRRRLELRDDTRNKRWDWDSQSWLGLVPRVVIDTAMPRPFRAVVARFDPAEEDEAAWGSATIRFRMLRIGHVEYGRVMGVLQDRADSWLQANYPRHADPTAYWDRDDIPVIETYREDSGATVVVG